MALGVPPPGLSLHVRATTMPPCRHMAACRSNAHDCGRLGVNTPQHGPAGSLCCRAEVPPLPVGFANITVPTTVLSPTLLQQLDHHFLRTNNSLSAAPLYFIFIGGACFRDRPQPGRQMLPGA